MSSELQTPPLTQPTMGATPYPRLIPQQQLSTMAADQLVPPIPVASIPPVPLSQDLLHQLTSRLQESVQTTTKEFIALCHYNINPDLGNHLSMLSGSQIQAVSAQVTLGIKAWLAKNLHLESNNNTPTRSRRTRSSTATKRTRDRDELKCVVTNQSDPLEVAHIFPLSSYSNGHSQASFLSLLELFASPDIAYNVSTYLGLLPSPSGPPQPPSQLKINRLENLITLLQPVHSYLDDGKIILEPVGDPLSIFDNPDPADPPVLTHYDVIFSYLPSHRTPAGPAGWDQTSVTQTEPIATLQYTEHTDPVLSRLGLLRRGTSWEVLTTGTVIRLVTTDPAKRPLPHPDLLRLHAALSRVVRCAAAAEPKITGYDEDSEEEEEEGVEENLPVHGDPEAAKKVWKYLESHEGSEEEEGVEENLPVHGDPEAAKKVWKYLESHEGSEEEEGVKGHRPVHGDPEAEKAWKYLGSLPSPWNTHGQRTFCT